jgi:hypothetical protein
MHCRLGNMLVVAVAFTFLLGGSSHAQRKSYTYETDPPAGSVPCGKTVTVKSSKKCGGKPATIIGGCNRGGTSSGAKRETKCEK